MQATKICKEIIEIFYFYKINYCWVGGSTIVGYLGEDSHKTNIRTSESFLLNKFSGHFLWNTSYIVLLIRFI